MGGNGNITTGSMLNKSIIAANRHKGSGRTSYTSMSREVNGRVVIVDSGSGHCCETSNSKSAETLAKIQAYTALAGSAAQLVAGIGNIFASNKSSSTAGADPTRGNANLHSTLEEVNNSAAGAGSAGGAGGAGGAAETKGAASYITDMENCKYSRDLDTALNSATLYLNGALKDSLTAAEGRYNTATRELKNLKDNDLLKKAENGVKTARQKVNRQAEDISKILEPKLEQAKSNLTQAENDLAAKNDGYRTALEQRRGSENKVAILKSQVDGLATTAASAQRAFATIEAQYNAADADGKAALQTQYDTAKTARDKAEQDLKTAQGQLKQAETELEGFKSAEAAALAAVDVSNDEVKTLKEGVTKRQKELATAQTNYDNAQATLIGYNTELRNATTGLTKLKSQKEGWEQDIKNYESIKKEYEALDKSVKEQQKRKTKLIANEQKEITRLEAEIKKYSARSDAHSNNIDSQNGGFAGISGDTSSNRSQRREAKKMTKDEDKETQLRSKLADLRAHSLAAPTEVIPASVSTATSTGDNTAAVPPGSSQSSDKPLNPTGANAFVKRFQNDQALQNLKLGIVMHAEINGKQVMRMPIGDPPTYQVDGKNYTFEELQKAVQDGTI